MSRRTGEISGESPAWDDSTLISPHEQADKAARVERMFDAIAPTYERVNRIASLGQDARWRRRAARAHQPRDGSEGQDERFDQAGTAPSTRGRRTRPGITRLSPQRYKVGVLR